MAEAYSVIASDGVLHPATFVSKIVGPTGKVLYETPKQGGALLTAEVARSETQMLTEVLEERDRAGLTIDRPAALARRDDRPEPGRVVHRVHAAAHDRGVDGRPQRRDAR